MLLRSNTHDLDRSSGYRSGVSRIPPRSGGTNPLGTGLGSESSIRPGGIMNRARPRARAAIMVATAISAVAMLVSIPTAASAASGPTGLCVSQTAAGISAMVGTAVTVTSDESGAVSEAIAGCSAPTVQALSAYTGISSPWGVRVHPITGVTTMHYGTDYARSGISGTPILSIADGTVAARIDSYATTGTGNSMVISHADGVRSQYMHMIRPTTFTVGQKVEAGDVIGYVGATGGVTGPHLHLEVKVNGTSVDPALYLANAPFLR
jgi:murein DD-endopeptidase MepM/ murein hydrolase activator NlpD